MILGRESKEENDVNYLHICSDGPTTQYRNKCSFWLFDYFIRSEFSDGSWNMFEAGHEKGAV